MLRYWSEGEPDDLPEAINTFREALERAPADAFWYPLVLSNLSGALWARYKLNGDLTDLAQSIAAMQQVASLIPSNASERAGCLDNLGTLRLSRHEHTRDPSDLEQAINEYREALNLTPPESPLRARMLSNLGNALLSRLARGGGEPADLDRAVEAHQEALEITHPESPDRASVLNNLSRGLLARYVSRGDLQDLDNAIIQCRQAVALSPPSTPERPSRLSNLGHLLSYRYSHNKSAADLEEACGHWHEACQSGLEIACEIALEASQWWGELALHMHDWREAKKALGYGQQAIDLLFQTQLSGLGKRIWLREAQSLPARLAYALARDDDLALAVAAMERGRARLLAEVQERERRDLEGLTAKGHGRLYQRYQAAARRIHRLETAELLDKRLPSDFDHVTEIRDARAELGRVIEEIRHVPGYDGFFSLPTFEQIQRTLTADGKAGVYLLAVAQGGLALIVHWSGVKEIWLDTTEQDLNGWLVKREGERITGGYLPAQMGDTLLDTTLDELLPTLGEKVAGPLALALRELGVQAITLIPAGRLALLPLHSACYRVNNHKQTLLDEFVVSYAPSARALGHARAMLARRVTTAPRLLAVCNPLPSDMKPLVFARPEVEEIESLFAARTVLYEATATRAAVKHSLSEASYLHFSCHGYFSPAEPLESGILLGGGERLTVEDLIAGEGLENARLAVLSACQTAITDFDRLPEEAVGLPSGFMQAGVPGVVGTLWCVNDLSTALLMIRFYEKHLRENLPPAAALRAAQLWLRNVTKSELSELFDFYRKQARDRPATRMVYETAQENFRKHTLSEPDKKPFAHPFYWAPFVLYGA